MEFGLNSNFHEIGEIDRLDYTLHNSWLK